MHQPMQGAKRQAKDEREHNANLAIERCMIALHDYGSRPKATRAKILKALRDEGFTADEIAEAARRMGA